MTRNELLALVARHLPHLRREHGVSTLTLFGSVARNEARPGSDVDLLVEFDRPTGLFGLLRLQHELEQLLGVPVDLGTPGSLRPSMRQRVAEEAVRVA